MMFAMGSESMAKRSASSKLFVGHVQAVDRLGHRLGKFDQAVGELRQADDGSPAARTAADAIVDRGAFGDDVADGRASRRWWSRSAG
jgi:hypothetical protein